MARVCPRCHGTSPQMLCPRCGVRTVDIEAAASMPAADADTTSTAGALLIGLLLAQGLYYGLRHLAVAWRLTTSDPATEAEFWDRTVGGLITLQALQAVALLAGGMVATAGRRHGVAMGTALGVFNAVLILTLQRLMHQPTDEFSSYGQPLLNAFVGAVGGAIGSRVWQPPPELPPLIGDGRTGEKALTTAIPDRPVEVLDEPWPWGHIALGAAIAVGGTLGARVIRDFVVMAGGGTGREMQSQFITWEIALVAQVIGGTVAGAGTRGGALYGFWVGVAAAVCLAVVQSLAVGRVPAHSTPGWLIGGAGADASPAGLTVLAIQAVLLGIVGGWLGGLVLPADPGRRNPPEP
jgi:hypothetical protein